MTGSSFYLHDDILPNYITQTRGENHRTILTTKQKMSVGNSKDKKLKRNKKGFNWFFFCFLLCPVVCLSIVFVVWPLAAIFYYSF